MIINSIAMGLSVSLIPHMVSNYVKKDFKEVTHKFNQAISVILVSTLPMAIGIAILSDPIYYLFYGHSTYGGIILKILAFVAIFSSINIVICTSLQGLNKFKTVYTCTIMGFLTNALLDLPLIYLCNKIGIYPFYGACFSSMIGYSVSYTIALISLKKQNDMNYKDIIITLKKVMIPLICMSIPIFILNYLINLDNYNKVIVLLFLILYAIIGAVIYFYLTYKNGVLLNVFGKEYLNKLIRKINIFKKFKIS
jgi:O-antigen/teichoic acid export membrane protein